MHLLNSRGLAGWKWADFLRSSGAIETLCSATASKSDSSCGVQTKDEKEREMEANERREGRQLRSSCAGE